jgi:hypothetical protein
MKKILICIIFLSLCAFAQEKILILNFGSVDLETEPLDLNVYSNFFKNEVRGRMKNAVVLESYKFCSTPFCAMEEGKKADADKVLYGVLSKMPKGKTLIEIKEISTSNGIIDYSTQKSVYSLSNIEKFLEDFAEAYAERKQIYELPEYKIESWRENVSSFISFRAGYFYALGDSSYITPEDETAVQKVFDLDISYMYFLSPHIATEILIRTQHIDRGSQIYLPFYYISDATANHSFFIGGGPGFGFGPSFKRDGLTFMAAGGIMLFRHYDFSYIIGGRYTRIIDYPYYDSGIGLYVGFAWNRK